MQRSVIPCVSLRARVLIGRSGLKSYSSLKAHLAPIRAAATFAQPYGTLDKQELWWMGIVHADTHTRDRAHTQAHTRTQNIVRLRFWRSASSSNIRVSRYGRLCGPAERFWGDGNYQSWI